ncbi:MAG: PAS domain-containing protein [Demequinaceae bacterium]|nr:PAS domain-containing protein [Demequinaceae bacterium]
MGPPPNGGVDRAKTRASSQVPRKPGVPRKRTSSTRAPQSASTAAPRTIAKPESTGHEHFTQFARSMPFIVWTANPQGVVDYFNQGFVDYTRREPSALIGDGWASVLHPDDVPGVMARWEHSVSTGEVYEAEFRILRSDGEYRWHKVQAKTELDDDGTIIRWWGTALDIHETRMLKERAATLAEEREAILESLADSVLTLDREFRFTYLNSHAEALVQMTREEALGRALWEALPELAQKDEYKTALTSVLESGQPVHMQEYSDSNDRYFDVTISPLIDGLTVYARDITQVKSLSDQLAIAHRLEAIGQLTGGIAHDFNNLLTVVMGAVESLSLEEDLSPAGQEMLELVSQATTRGAELTHRLLAFARQQPLAPQAINVSQHVTSLIPLLQRTLGDEIEVASSLARGLPPALVDPGQFESAILNLGINARDAMPEGGLLELETGITELDEEYAATHSDIQPGRYIIVSVGDTGTGIPPEHLERLFDPFFTTKPVGQGSGLGLAMVWGFVKQSGGHVSVYSEPHRGTTIRLYLPIASESFVKDNEPSEATPPAHGTGRILLVEDDRLVRHFATEQLSAHGYKVTATGSGPEALKALESIQNLDLLFTDVILPGGLTGRQLAQRIVALRPGTPVLYASGYTESVLMHDGRLDPDVSLLTKPYTGRQLVERVNEMVSIPGSEAGET